jgi:hypothetical protein
MSHLVRTLILTALLALGTAGPALAWDQCTKHMVKGPDGITRFCELCCRRAGPDNPRIVCQWLC